MAGGNESGGSRWGWGGSKKQTVKRREDTQRTPRGANRGDGNGTTPRRWQNAALGMEVKKRAKVVGQGRKKKEWQGGKEAV